MTEQASYHITSTHPDSAKLLRSALEHNAAFHRSMAVNSRTRILHPGETREQLERRALVHDDRAEALEAMAGQLPDR